MKLPTALLIALQLLTRLPVQVASSNDADTVRSLYWYPAVGLLIGAVLWLLAGWPTTAHGAHAALLLAVWVALTGALHLDGLADSADGWLGGHGDRQRSLEIMRDPRIGAAGAVALGVALLGKFAALQALLAQDRAMALLGVCALSRACVPLLYATTDYVRAGGLGETLARGCSNGLATTVVALTAFVAIAVLGSDGVVCVLATGGLFVLCRMLMCRTIGGATGDTTGATIEVLETGALLALALSV